MCSRLRISNAAVGALGGHRNFKSTDCRISQRADSPIPKHSQRQGSGKAETILPQQSERRIPNACFLPATGQQQGVSKSIFGNSQDRTECSSHARSLVAEEQDILTVLLSFAVHNNSSGKRGKLYDTNQHLGST